ncbi:hypothetical protein L2E82_12113 [Cichorium intybus]|uniref:Uncharacterized protein n=1 Tax=Cichorium intybus TaxID=13427 RepID=A0ACB9GGE5_CICIN|nr:hypothetical protein L2E82_12113 [Cichorium intybus]
MQQNVRRVLKLKRLKPKPEYVPDVLYHIICVSLSLLLSRSPGGTLIFSPSTMKFRLRVMDADAHGQQNPIYQSQSSSSSSPYTYFTEQASRGGFSSGTFSGGHGGPEMFRGGFDMRDAIRWEVEKERIRAEIIAEEMARKRILEEEVRHELMMEREMIAMRSGGGFPSPCMPLSLPPSHYRLSEPGFFSPQPVGLEERVILSLDKRNSRGGCGGGGGHPPEIRGFDVDPFQRFADSPVIQGIPTPFPESSQKEVIILGKPNGGTLTGAKRKPTQPATTGESSESYSETSKKKIKEEWSCAICHVTATSERGLNEHLQGKKHQLKEAALISQKTGANLGLGVAPMKPVVKPVKLAVTTVNLSSREKKRKNRKASSGNNCTPSTDNTSSANGSNKKNKDKFKFWCEMCKVGAFTEKVMNNHKEGKKHTANLVELLQKVKPVIPCDIEEKTGSETKETEVKPVEEEEEGGTSVSI